MTLLLYVGFESTDIKFLNILFGKIKDF